MTIRSALTVSNLLPYPIELKLDNSAFEKQRPLQTHPEKEMEIISFSMKPKEALSIPLNYVWARIFARPKSGGIGQWKYSEIVEHQRKWNSTNIYGNSASCRYG